MKNLKKGFSQHESRLGINALIGEVYKLADEQKPSYTRNAFVPEISNAGLNDFVKIAEGKASRRNSVTLGLP
jgi:hypothetical protein